MEILPFNIKNNNSWLLEADPFFKAGAPGATLKAEMQQDLTLYTSRVLNFPVAAAVNPKGVTEFVDYMLYCADSTVTVNTTSPNKDWNTCSPVSTCRVQNREWAMFKRYLF